MESCGPSVEAGLVLVSVDFGLCRLSPACSQSRSRRCGPPFIRTLVTFGGSEFPPVRHETLPAGVLKGH